MFIWQLKDKRDIDGPSHRSTTRHTSMSFVILDSKIEPEKERLTPEEYIKEVHIRLIDFHTTEMGTTLTKAKEKELVPS